MNDSAYLNLPWKPHGRSTAGVDCVGLAWLWLTREMNLPLPPPKPAAPLSSPIFSQYAPRLSDLHRGDIILFSSTPSTPSTSSISSTPSTPSTPRVTHVAIALDSTPRLLHIIHGAESRIENGFTLLRRCGLSPVAAIPASDSQALAAALADPRLGDAVSLILLAVSFALSFASGFLSPATADEITALSGKYGKNSVGLETASNPELPLPDILGGITVAGNSVYQQTPDKDALVDNDPPQAWCQIVVLNSGPSVYIDTGDGFQINGVNYQDKSFFSGSNHGVYLNPAQTKAEAWTGTIGTDTLVPSVTIYPGDYDITVPVDIRAQYDRSFPVYGLSGCSYLAFRFINSENFSRPNFTIRVHGRYCRTFSAAGFTTTAVANESLAGADGTKVRFKLATSDIAAVSAVTVNGTAYSRISASTQTGNLYHLNATKGFIEFITAPANAATILVSYTYYPREFTRNPASHIVYLLTEPRRGKAFSADRIDWAAAVVARDYYDEEITWVNSNGSTTGPRYETNYALDQSRPVQDHLQAILDACQSILFLSGGKFILRPIKSEASVFSFNSTNILVDSDGKSTFSATLVDRSGKANRLKVTFYSDENLNAETEVIADDEANQAERSGRGGDNGISEATLKLPAVTTFPQAERLALSTLAENVGSNWRYSWRTTVKALALQPGDVVDVTHGTLPTITRYLRITSLTHDENDYLAIEATEYVPAAYL